MPSVYLDNAATTPVREEVREAMLPYLYGTFGNPSSPHRWGRAAAKALWEARERVAGAIGCLPVEVYFTSGGTEADNLAVVGGCRQLHESEGTPPTVATTVVEHHAVLDAVRRTAGEGDAAAPALELGVTADGEMEMDRLTEALECGPCMASIMWVNNETGMMLPLAEIAGRFAEREGCMLHTDAVQAIGKTDLSLRNLAVDMVSITGHKIYGPKGTGALVVRRGTKVAPLLVGGGQERGLRPGTEDVAGAVGFSFAVDLAEAEREERCATVTALRDRLEREIVRRYPGVTVNAVAAARVGSVTSLHFPDVNTQSIVFGLDMEGIACSGGSACSSGSSGSHVIDALYPGRGGASVRFSLGRDTTDDDISLTLEAVERVMARRS
ncbi:MAG: cysteine desulfurase [Gemmatimonadetes bacterium]|nr:cysteine desulfurase [Gemmatimonadota bacterium]